MSLRETLKAIVEAVEGGLGATIMGYDGIPIDEYLASDGGLDLRLMAVEYATIMKEVRAAVDVLKTGELEELAVNTERSRVIIRAINDELFLILAMTPDGNFGKGRYLLRREAPEFGALLA